MVGPQFVVPQVPLFVLLVVLLVAVLQPKFDSWLDGV